MGGFAGYYIRFYDQAGIIVNSALENKFTHQEFPKVDEKTSVLNHLYSAADMMTILADILNFFDENMNQYRLLYLASL